MTHNDLYASITLSSVALLIAVAALAGAIIASWPRRHLAVLASAALVVAEIVLLSVRTTPLLPGVGFALTALGIVLAVVGGGPVVTTVLAFATRGSMTEGRYGGIVVDATPQHPRTHTNDGGPTDAADAHTRADVGTDAQGGAAPAARVEVLRGGATIGYLERVAVAASLVAGYPEGLAVVVAIKGVGRFTELSEPESRERFIIGTFASLVWACAGAAIALLAR